MIKLINFGCVYLDIYIYGILLKRCAIDDIYSNIYEISHELPLIKWLTERENLSYMNFNLCKNKDFDEKVNEIHCLEYLDPLSMMFQKLMLKK